MYYKTDENNDSFKKRRLITTGLNGTVIEWDLLNKCPKSKYSAHAAIWQSRVLGKFIYLACEDGSVKILKIKKEKIELIKSLVKVETRCLSLDI